MRNLKKGILFTAAAALAFISGCNGKTAINTDEILTLPAVTGNVRDHITFIGNVAGGQTSSLTWGTNGVIGSVDVKLGDTVREGQILSVLETDSLSADIINAEIPYITAIEDLEEVLESETPKAEAYKNLKDKEGALEDAEKYKESLKYPHAVLGDVLYWQDQVEDYRHLYEEALETLNDAAGWRKSTDKFEHNQYESRRKAMLDALNKYAEVYNNYLYYSGHATENDIAQAAADIGVAQADYEKALKVFRTYSSYPREKDINDAQVKVENAKNTYNRRNIIAPINGVVTQINAREGDYVTKGTAAFRLDNTEHLYIPMDISEIDILEIRDGMKAEIILDAYTSKTYQGVVTTVSASGTASGSRVTFQTMVEILEPDDKVKIGMTAEVNLVTEEKENVLIVPANAVYKIGNDTYVGVYNGMTCNDVPVTVGMESDTVAEITSGFLKEKDTVCVPSVDSRLLEAMGLGEKEEEPTEEEPGGSSDAYPADSGGLLIAPGK